MPTVDKSAYRTAAYRQAVAALKANPDTPCAYCPNVATTIDHAIPVALGGGDMDLVPACWDCNARRGSALGHALKKKRRAALAQSVASHPASHKARPRGHRFLDTETQDPPACQLTLPGGLPLDAPPSRIW